MQSSKCFNYFTLIFSMKCENAAVIRNQFVGDYTTGEKGLNIFLRIQIYVNWVSVSRLALQKEKGRGSIKEHSKKKKNQINPFGVSKGRVDLRITRRLTPSVTGTIGPSLTLRWKQRREDAWRENIKTSVFEKISSVSEAQDIHKSRR